MSTSQDASSQSPGDALVDRSAVALAATVRSGEVSAVEVARAHLERIEERDPEIGAFQTVDRERVLEEAAAADGREDRRELPLAGVPVPVKDNIAVAGYPTREGSRATSTEPEGRDHELVRRLRAAGAVVLGKTRLPELALWGTTDSAFGITRSPADPSLTAGGSSGGSAAAVASKMCPLAHGNDGLGSIRIPAACCGIFGIKPGAGVVPSAIGQDSFAGLAENGPLARTVSDGALLLSVMAGRSDWREVGTPSRSLRIALSTKTPLPGLSPEPGMEETARRVAGHLEEGGHTVEKDDPPYSAGAALQVITRWFEGARNAARDLPQDALESRTRRHVQLAGITTALGLRRSDARERWRRRLAPFFERHDLLITPSLAATPPPAVAWSRRSWAANVWANTRFAPYSAPWNLAGYPAASVPVRRGRSARPVSVQLVGPAGAERLLLLVARQIEVASLGGG